MKLVFSTLELARLVALVELEAENGRKWEAENRREGNEGHAEHLKRRNNELETILEKLKKQLNFQLSHIKL